jgi:MFS family permease
VGGPITDRIWRHLQNKAGGATAPEYRVPLVIPGALLIPIGLLWYGWAAEALAHWIVSDIGASVFGCGIILGTQAMQAYVMDSYSQHTASVMAAAQLLRSIVGFAFPTFAPGLYGKLRYGWGNSMLAFAFNAICVPAPLFLWKFGARIRAKGKPQL